MEDKQQARFEHPLFVGALEKAIRVLEAFGEEKSDWGISEIAERADVSVSTAQRFIFSFCELGYLRRDDRSRRYRLTERILKPAHNYLKSNELVRVVSPVLLRLQDRCPHRVDLSVRSDLDVVVLSRTINPNLHAEQNPIGRTVRMIHSSGGRAIMSHLDDEEIADVMARTEREALTPYTLQDDAAILDKIEEARLKGYSIAEQEAVLGESLVSAALLDSRRRPVAAIHISAQSSQWPASRIEAELVPLLFEATASIGTVP